MCFVAAVVKKKLKAHIKLISNSNLSIFLQNKYIPNILIRPKTVTMKIYMTHGAIIKLKKLRK